MNIYTTPQMGPKKVNYLERLLLSFKKEHIDVLEWGSGGSTVYFTNFLKEKGVSFTWTSLEYNKEWYEEIRKEVEDRPEVSLVLFDVGNTKTKQRDNPMNEYVEYPKTLNKKFDLIIVDGRKRMRCVIEAKELLAEGGVVMLDDAFRPYYWPAFKHYKDSKFLWRKFWQGTNKDINILQLSENTIKNLWFFADNYIRFQLRRIKGKILSK